nr:hypothetical protein [Azospirillum sp. TSA2s]
MRPASGADVEQQHFVERTTHHPGQIPPNPPVGAAGYWSIPHFKVGTQTMWADASNGADSVMVCRHADPLRTNMQSSCRVSDQRGSGESCLGISGQACKFRQAAATFDFMHEICDAEGHLNDEGLACGMAMTYS